MLHILGQKSFPEMQYLEKMIQSLPSHNSHVNQLAVIKYKKQSFPIYAITLGPEDLTTPCLAIFAGVHGLERIGCHVALSYLHTVKELMKWDENFNKYLEKTRIIIVPIVNPVGVYLESRSNGNGVDLMRNSPLVSPEIPKYQFFSGHKLGPYLPYYRGGDQMEKEAQAVCDLVMQEISTSKMAISLDIHSGLGLRDRLWFPFAYTKKPFDDLGDIYQLKKTFDDTYPNHVYLIEPQSINYLTHGDLWDYLYLQGKEKNAENKFLPLTLELGSWMWVKKSPLQIFNRLGTFNPLQPHRYQRVMRRHLHLIDFLFRAVSSNHTWMPQTEAEKQANFERGMDQWYSGDKKKK